MRPLDRLTFGLLPLSVRRRIRRAARGVRRALSWPPIGAVDFGDLRRLEPVSREFGLDRGVPIDRHYIECFLERHSADVRGRVLEIKDSTYTRRYGGERVTASDVLHKVEGNPQATIVADLTDAAELASDAYDCVICTQTLQFIYDLRAALRTLLRILKPGGVLLATVPGISPISRCDMEQWGDYWRFTSRSLTQLLEEQFPAENVEVAVFGNALTATAFLQGIAAEELEPHELEPTDSDFELLLAARARKPLGG